MATMELGILGPAASVQKVMKVVGEARSMVRCYPILYTELSQIPTLLAASQSRVEGILFTGVTPFRYACHTNAPLVPWGYLPRNATSTLIAMLRASMQAGCDIRRISYDDFEDKMLRQVYKELEIPEDEVTVYQSRISVTEPDYAGQVERFHSQLYQQGKVSLCITGLFRVRDGLRAQGIPVARVRANDDLILQQVDELRLQQQLLLNEERRLGVVLVEVLYTDGQTVVQKSPLHFLKLESSIAEVIYLFGQRNGAAVVKQRDGLYTLLSEKKTPDMESAPPEYLELLDALAALGNLRVNIGIGLAAKASQAQINSELARKKASSQLQSSCFILYDDEHSIGPISRQQGEQSSGLHDSRLEEIARVTGISVSNLLKIDRVMRQFCLDEITPAELANLSGFSLRSMNRILLQLEDHGYLSVVGKRSVEGSGRPSRVLRIELW